MGNNSAKYPSPLTRRRFEVAVMSFVNMQEHDFDLKRFLQANGEGYKRRWKIERLFAWLNKFRKVIARWEHCAERYTGFVYLAF